MSSVDFDKLVDLLERSQLVEPAKLKRILSEHFLLPERRTAPEMARVLVERQVLTQWQADNLLKGKHKGFLLGRYRLLDQLGRGGMSTVYLAEHQLMKRRAAIKVLPRQRVNDRSYLGRFLREAQATATLDHPHIVRVYDIAAEGKTHFIAMEYVEGRDLHTLVTEDGPLSYVQAADFVAQAAVGLQHAHDQGLTHRDIKPANLLAGVDGTLKILDLGLAKFHDDSLPSLTIAHEDNVLGTVDYLAPEQAEDSHQVDSRVDIYGLGCTLYFLLTGHPPFPKGTLAQRVLKHQKQEPAPVRHERPDVPFQIEDLCRRMMIKDPRKRIQTAVEVAEELVRWLHRAGAHSQAEGPLAELRKRSHRPVPAGLAAAPEPAAGARFSFLPPAPSEPARGAPAGRASLNEDLELVPTDDESVLFSGRSGPPSSAGEPSRSAPSSGAEAQAEDDRWEEQVSILEQELAPLEASSHDSLLSGERIKVERHLPPSDSTAQRPAAPPSWVWWSVGATVALIVLGILALQVL